MSTMFEPRTWQAKLLGLGLIAASVPLTGACLRWSGDYLHLLVMYPYYYNVISANEGCPTRFPWGDDALFATDGCHIRTLVYDASGTTMHSETEHLIGNFFLEHLDYP